MRTHARLLPCVLIGCFIAGNAFAQGWKGSEIDASVSNRANTSTLVIECISNGSIFMRVQFRAYTNIWFNETAVVRIGEKTFPVEIGIGSEHMYLHNLPKLGISPELIAALKGGGTLVLEGKAVQRLPDAQRTFPLDGAAKFIEEVQRIAGGSF
ncbi:MAG: hypothetical protein K2P86_13915 [Xanthobacteraceae bacterium]|nr:hypothetical protein [Xanthobacteraceae bacterium]